MEKIWRVLGLTFGLSLLSITGLLFNDFKAEAAAYDSNYINFIPSAESNMEAINIVTKDGNSENIPFPLENLTTEQPNQSNRIATRAALKVYRANDYKEMYGFYQWRINELVPVGFNWYDNGIPSSVTKGFGQALTFNSGKITDTGAGAWQYGYYWRQFSTAQGTFWASVWDKNDLLY
ncbi:lytic exoenzyme target recognition domain-containing protein [Carnobacterium divergens]|uniref:Lytic exoenzyme target recognition domain-containing protein n=1 Tax=Carnobacterium divergens DSM 20623 TaxID=1449336 RepID=A0A0R2HXS0_CARDV|nr:lytic exoenzyme target recognition domain-containing protein [Carnobacterium divergens]KRN57529.1 hypothetical protein IV74_GL000048 [Carnobacterium divergens DSM 20623]MDO0875733.1 hypothetical protein [Carnobacterium divergens]SUX15013.1 Uncharacterised protein [Carnobacterium divergens]